MKQFALRLPERLMIQLKEEARKYDCSINQLLIKLISLGLTKEIDISDNINNIISDIAYEKKNNVKTDIKNNIKEDIEKAIKDQQGTIKTNTENIDILFEMVSKLLNEFNDIKTNIKKDIKEDIENEIKEKKEAINQNTENIGIKHQISSLILKESTDIKSDMKKDVKEPRKVNDLKLSESQISNKDLTIHDRQDVKKADIALRPKELSERLGLKSFQSLICKYQLLDSLSFSEWTKMLDPHNIAWTKEGRFFIGK